MKKTFFLPLVAAFCFTACSSDDEETLIKPTNVLEATVDSVPRLLTVEISENPMVDENGEPRQIMSRGTEITTSTLSEFFMYQKLWGQSNQFTKSGDTWSTYTWPSSAEISEKIDFYAYNDGTFSYNGGDPYVNFTVHDTPANQKDFLVATHKQISYSDANGFVNLTFDHACAALKFNICKTSGVGDKTVVIKSVTLSGVKDSGNYYYRDGSWGSRDGSATYTLNSKNITLSTDLVSLLPPEKPYLFLIPQTKTRNVKLTVEYCDNLEGENPQTHDFTWSSGEWSAGVEYTINIKMGTSIIK